MNRWAVKFPIVTGFPVQVKYFDAYTKSEVRSQVKFAYGSVPAETRIYKIDPIHHRASQIGRPPLPVLPAVRPPKIVERVEVPEQFMPIESMDENLIVIDYGATMRRVPRRSLRLRRLTRVAL